MILQLRDLFAAPGKRVPLQYEIPSESLSYVQGRRFDAPLFVQGEVCNHTGIVTLSLSVTTTMHVRCDRCLKELNWTFSYDFFHTVVPALSSGADDDEYVIASQEQLDVDEVAVSDLLLALPTKILCKEDCKGLCDICGCDLNEYTCSCHANLEGV